MSEHAPASVIIEPGAAPLFHRNVFQGLTPDVFRALGDHYAPGDQGGQLVRGPFHSAQHRPARATILAPDSLGPAAGSMMATIFHRLGPYEIVQEIGRGGMAVVFLASDTRTGRRVALKLVPQGTDREAREVLEAEQWGAELQQQFCRVSAHVPAVHEHGIESGYFYVAMEYPGRREPFRCHHPRPTRDSASGGHHHRALPLSRGCAPLRGGHRRSQPSLPAHGDLKPRNVRITAGDEVKVLDFGIAKALSLSRKVTRNDFGSVAYLSPERLESGEVDGHADYWAVGVLLYEMVSGTPPFQAADTRRLERQILSRMPPPSLADRCPVALQAVVVKLLGPQPIDRYESAEAIREDLERFQSGAQTRAEQEHWPDRAADEQATRRTRSAGDTVDEATRRTTQPDAHPLPAKPDGNPLPTTRDDLLPTKPEDLSPTKSGDRSRVSFLGFFSRTKPPTASDGSATQRTAPQVKRATKAGPPRRILRSALLILALYIVGNEIWVAKAAGRVAGSVPTRELGQLADVWGQYEQLSHRSYLRIGTMSLERSLTQQTANLAERVIGDYRTPLPTVRETQWKMAREALARAIAVAPHDWRLRAALRYCDGHLHRINGEAGKSRRQGAAAQREFTEAVAAFREAAELRPKWPDPFLGLARTFIYGLEDVDRGADALGQAQSTDLHRAIARARNWATGIAHAATRSHVMRDR